MCWKPSFREVMPWRSGVLACLLGAMLSGLCAQQPAADSTSKRAASQAKVTSNVVNNVAVQSNGLPVPFATVFNTNTCLLYTSPSPRD